MLWPKTLTLFIINQYFIIYVFKFSIYNIKIDLFKLTKCNFIFELETVILLYKQKNRKAINQ